MCLGTNVHPFSHASHTPRTASEGGFFKAELKFPDDFPNNPPKMKFLTKMYHPNIYPDGTVCISILHAPGVDAMNTLESADERWRPILGVEQVRPAQAGLLRRIYLGCNLSVRRSWFLSSRCCRSRT